MCLITTKLLRKPALSSSLAVAAMHATPIFSMFCAAAVAKVHRDIIEYVMHDVLQQDHP